LLIAARPNTWIGNRLLATKLLIAVTCARRSVVVRTKDPGPRKEVNVLNHYTIATS
jgi:hypothetical protein